jgi:hypothetical protein
MTGWAEFQGAAPVIGATGRRLLEEAGEAYLAIVRGDALPRLHPITVGFVDGRLLAFLIEGSPKSADLAVDGRFALHARQDPASPHEFVIRGRATPIADGAVLDRALAAWPFPAADGYRLFEFTITHAILGERPTADSWPPAYSNWHAPMTQHAGNLVSHESDDRR